MNAQGIRWHPTGALTVTLTPWGMKSDAQPEHQSVAANVGLLRWNDGHCNVTWQVNTARLFQQCLRVPEGSIWTVRAECPLEPSAGLEQITESLFRLDLTDAAGSASLATGSGDSLDFAVVPTKLPHAEGDPLLALEQLILTVWEHHVGLLRRLHRPATLHLGVGAGHKRSPLQTLLLLDALTQDGLADSWLAIIENPHRELEVEFPLAESGRARQPVLRGSKGPWSVPRAFESSRMPQRVRDRRPRRTVDTVPNRLAVAVAREIELLTEEVEQQVRTRTDSAKEAWLQIAARVRRSASEFRHHPVVKPVANVVPGDLSAPVLRRSAMYRPVLKSWLALHDGVALPPELERLLADPLKESWDLYEYWTWFALAEVLGKHARRDGVHLVAADAEDAFVGARKLKWKLRWDFRLRDGRTASLYYNHPSGKNGPYRSYSRSFRPDLALEIRGKGRRLVVLDAKYRVDVYQRFTDDAQGYAKTDDIKVMHGYRDALSDVVWALAIFPGDKPAVFPRSGRARHDLALLEQPTGGVGAIPASPGNTKILENAVVRLLRIPDE